MAPTETFCEGCGYHPTEETQFCPECGMEQPWDTRPKYQFNEDDLPLVVSYYHHDDHHGLWNQFCEDYFGARLRGSDIAGLPDDFPRMKFVDIEVYYAITEDCDLKGPFSSKTKAREEAYA